MSDPTTSPARPKPRGALLLWPALVLAVATGCQTSHPRALAPTTGPAPLGLNPPTPVASVQATVCIPTGWKAEPLKSSGSHTHQVWLSPTGHTALGVIHFTTPIPLSANFLLPFYMRAWKKDQGEATLISKQEDPNLPGIRFVAEGGLYKTWANLIVSGRDGWSIYAGVRSGEPIVPEELDLASAARERTRVGIDP